MQPAFHAILLILLPLVALGALFILKRRKPTDHQIVMALLFAVTGTLMAPALNRHLCLEGEPRKQWLVLGPCLFLVLLFTQSKVWRRLLGVALFISLMGLSFHFTHLVHEPGWTGNPLSDGHQKAIFRAYRKAAVELVTKTPDNDVELPAGWLRDTTLWPKVEMALERQLPDRREIVSVWHTPLTGLYPYNTVPQDVWYPGGPPKEAIAHIELRDRPISSALTTSSYSKSLLKQCCGSR